MAADDGDRLLRQQDCGCGKEVVAAEVLVVMKEVRGSKQIETKEISSTDTNQDEQGGYDLVAKRFTTNQSKPAT